MFMISLIFASIFFISNSQRIALVEKRFVTTDCGLTSSNGVKFGSESDLDTITVWYNRDKCYEKGTGWFSTFCIQNEYYKSEFSSLNDCLVAGSPAGSQTLFEPNTCDAGVKLECIEEADLPVVKRSEIGGIYYDIYPDLGSCLNDTDVLAREFPKASTINHDIQTLFGCDTISGGIHNGKKRLVQCNRTTGELQVLVFDGSDCYETLTPYTVYSADEYGCVEITGETYVKKFGMSCDIRGTPTTTDVGCFIVYLFADPESLKPDWGINAALSNIRQLRDNVLVQSRMGRKVIDMYYKIGKKMIVIAEKHSFLKYFFKTFFYPVVVFFRFVK